MCRLPPTERLAVLIHPFGLGGSGYSLLMARYSLLSTLYVPYFNNCIGDRTKRSKEQSPPHPTGIEGVLRHPMAEKLKGVMGKTQVITKSLILAQDERWRRA